MVASKYNVIFQIGQKNYVYNTSSQALIEIDNSVLNYLNDPQNTYINPEYVTGLLENGIMVESARLDLLRLKNNVNNLKYDRLHVGVFIGLTSSCNLCCTYCYQDVRRKPDLNKDYIDNENWSKMYSYFQCCIARDRIEKFTFFLFGGEPMLNSERLQDIISDLEKLRTEQTKISIVLITNGTLFTSENACFFAEKIDSIQITVDGTQKVHDQARVDRDGNGSFERIYNSIKLLISSKPQGELNIRMNVSADTVGEAYKFIDFMVTDGLHQAITSIKFSEIFSTQAEVQETNGQSENGDCELAEKIGKLYIYAAKKGVRTYKDLGGPCIGKMNYSYSIDENLNIYVCPGLIYSENQGFLSGETIKITNPQWYEFVQEDTKCLDTCKYAPICYGGCNWSKGKKEKNCMKSIYDVSLVPKLQAYTMSTYQLVVQPV